MGKCEIHRRVNRCFLFPLDQCTEHQKQTTLPNIHYGHNAKQLKFKLAYTNNHTTVYHRQYSFISTFQRTVRYPLLHLLHIPFNPQRNPTTQILTLAPLYFLVRPHQVSQWKHEPRKSSDFVFHLGTGKTSVWFLGSVYLFLLLFKTFSGSCHDYRCLQICVVSGYVFSLREFM